MIDANDGKDMFSAKEFSYSKNISAVPHIVENNVLHDLSVVKQLSRYPIHHLAISCAP